MKRRLGSLALLLAAILAQASCGGSLTPHPSASASATSGIDGIMLLWPGGMSTDATPSPLPSGFGSVRELQPSPHAVAVIRAPSAADAGQVVGRVRSDDQGIFRVALPPGTYLLTGKGLGWERKQVTVRAGDYARVRIANLAMN